MTHYKRLFACAPACAIVACRDAMAPHGTPSDLNGEWTEDFSHTSVAGDGFFVSLNESAGVVTGQGAYSAEAGPSGFLEISGMARGDAVHLSIVYTPNSLFPQVNPDTARFDGVLTTRVRIDGTLVRGGRAQPFSLVPLRGDPL